MGTAKLSKCSASAWWLGVGWRCRTEKQLHCRWWQWLVGLVGMVVWRGEVSVENEVEGGCMRRAGACGWLVWSHGS